MSENTPCHICGIDDNDWMLICYICKINEAHFDCALVDDDYLCEECDLILPRTPTQPSRTNRNTMSEESCDEESVKPCDTCGSDAKPDLIMTCNLCEMRREHTYCYCTSKMYESVPDVWECEECCSITRTPRTNQNTTATESCDQELEPCEEDPEEDIEEHPEEEQEPCEEDPK